MTPDAIRDLLLEAARYAATDPDEAARLCELARVALCDDYDPPAPSPPGVPGSDPTEWLCRLNDNLHVGLAYLRADPGVFQAYCRAAAFELSLGRREGGGE